MSVIRDLMIGAAFLVPIGAGVGLVAVFGRDRTADEHDLSDYRAEPTAELEPEPARPAPPAAPGSRAAWPLVDRKPMPPRRALRPAEACSAPASQDGTTPPFARALLIEMAVPTLSDAVIRATADDWLREIAAEQQARAGVRPASEHWAGRDGSCWADCPACARDLVGAFPVVRAA